MKITVVILLAIIAIGVAIAARLGGFMRVGIAEEEMGPFTLVYRDAAAGEMIRVGTITTALDSLLQAQRFTSRKPLDVFMPNGTGEIGFAVYGVSSDRLASLGDVAKVRTIPAQRFMSASFPWRNHMSLIVGYLKTNHALAAYRATRGYSKVETLALTDGDRIIYMQPIAHR